MTPKTNIVIAGGGFGGISAALCLDKAMRRLPASVRAQYRVVLVNNHHSHLYTPALYEIAAIAQGEHALQYVKSSITIPLAEIFHGTSIEWLERTIVRVDRAEQTLVFDNDEKLPYEYLALALGAETAYFNVPGAEEHSMPLKTFADAVRLRDCIQLAIEDESPNLSIVIAGGGATGVEVAAEFKNFICSLRDIRYPNKKCRIGVTIVEGNPEILAGFRPSIVKKAKSRLQKLGVKVITGAAVSRVNKNCVTLADGSIIPCSILVWAAGVKANRVLETLGLPLSKKGSLPVDEYLAAGKNIYAIGDNSCFINPATGQPLPWNVPIAEDEARVVAANIIADISGKPKERFRPWKQYPFILALGSKYAVADFVYFRISGRAAWALKLLVELRYLLFILPPWGALSTWWKYVTVSRSNDNMVHQAHHE